MSVEKVQEEEEGGATPPLPPIPFLAPFLSYELPTPIFSSRSKESLWVGGFPRTPFPGGQYLRTLLGLEGFLNLIFSLNGEAEGNMILFYPCFLSPPGTPPRGGGEGFPIPVWWVPAPLP